MNEKLKDFIGYCEANPTERFWQALRNWSGTDSIYLGSMVKKDNVSGTAILDGIKVYLTDTYFME